MNVAREDAAAIVNRCRNGDAASLAEALRTLAWLIVRWRAPMFSDSRRVKNRIKRIEPDVHKHTSP